MLFEKEQNFIVSKEDKKVLNDHKGTKEWETLKRVVESSSLKWMTNVLLGSEIEQGMRAKELEHLSGFLYYFNKLVGVVENKLETNETEPTR